MVSKVDSYKCDICDGHYLTEEDAKFCETTHTTAENLEISDMFFKRDHEYPSMLIVTNSKSSGHGGLYSLQKEGSIEGVYEEFDSQKKYNNYDEDDY